MRCLVGRFALFLVYYRPESPNINPQTVRGVGYAQATDTALFLYFNLLYYSCAFFDVLLTKCLVIFVNFVRGLSIR